MKPLISLLGKKGGDQWKPEHTDCLNRLAAAVAGHVKLGLVNLALNLKFHVSKDGTNMACVAS